MDTLIHLTPRQNTLYVSQNRTVLATAQDGFIHNEPERGLFVYETRMLSRYRYLIRDQQPQHVCSSNIEQHSWLGYYMVPAKPAAEDSETPQQTVELKLSRFVADGFHEDVDITNFSQYEVSFELSLELDADFAAVEETYGKRVQHGRLERSWRENASTAPEMRFDYHADRDYQLNGTRQHASIDRAIAIRITRASTPPSYQEGSITFHVRLSPHQSWHVCIDAIPFVDGKKLDVHYGCHAFASASTEFDTQRRLFLNRATRFESRESHTLSHVVTNALEQGKKDIHSLRLYDLELPNQWWTMAAGLPIYVALFGRDTLTASWQAALSDFKMMPGTLQELAELQGKTIDDWRDEQPGRMLHEARTGPLDTLQYTSRERSYGSVTTSGFYPVVLAELWHWSGNKDWVRASLQPALKALQWLDEYSDLDHDGFYEYKTRSPQGVENQAWKDSGDAMVYEDGTQAKAPISTCEEQAFVYAAKFFMAEVLWWMDEKDLAKKFWNDASELKKRFNDAFWMSEERYFAMALDAEKRQLKSISSNPGHCIAAGIVHDDLIASTVQRFMQDDLFSGWGIRTLSCKHPAFNPYSYHRGTVWPVESGTFAIGLMRYGFVKELHRLAKGTFEVASFFSYYRLPELFSGHHHDYQHPFPALYPRANWPQAWSASAVFAILQAMLGLYPYAPLNLLLVDPHLPVWLPEITLRGLKVGEASITIRFYRIDEERTDYEILDVRGKLRVLRQPSPWSLTAGWGERLQDAVASILP